jgi:large subunit ribosomal protein L18
MKIRTRQDRRARIALRLRKRIRGTAERPRLSVFRSLNHIYVQAVDDMAGRTIAAASSIEGAIKAKMPAEARGGNNAGADAVGKVVAERLLEKGIRDVVFDRNGFLYHGRVKAVADAARKAGLQF